MKYNYDAYFQKYVFFCQIIQKNWNYYLVVIISMTVIYITEFNSTWRDMWSSMLTHTRNLCSAVNKHTHREHTPGAVGSHFTHNRSSLGFGALLKGTSVMVLKVERPLDIHSSHKQILPVPRLEPVTFGLRVRLSNHSLYHN